MSEGTYSLTPEGARLLKKAQKQTGKTYAALAKELRATTASLHQIFHERQKTCSFLPDLCKTLGVPFYRTQPMPEYLQDGVLLLEAMHNLDPEALRQLYQFLEVQIDGLRLRRGDYYAEFQ